MTILEAIFVYPNPSLLFNLSALREKSFGRLWINNGISSYGLQSLSFLT